MAQSKYRVLVTDYIFPNLEPERTVLEAIGAEVIAAQCRSAEEVMTLGAEVDGILNQAVRLDSRVMPALKRCKVIVRYGVGVDNVDVEAATRHGIYVCNVPFYATREVADHTLALLLSLVRKVSLMDRAVRSGRWDYKLSQPIRRLEGSVLGIVGLGNIGRAVARRAQGFGLRVIAYDPYLDDAVFQHLGVERVDFPTLLQQSDYVSLHTPLTPETHHLFNRAVFQQMKRGAILVNAARGPVVNETDLYEALQQGWLAGAALDVMEKEPPGKESPLFTLDNVLITPHMAWYSEEAGADLQRLAAEEVARVLQGNPPLSPVNPQVKLRGEG
ncbi:MAG: C-terminal binding protein [Nitrospinota bacterium]|nr:MAG: C-terminal binding protein [Nitrospinota bacterium]